jgi:hypothetical protein
MQILLRDSSSTWDARGYRPTGAAAQVRTNVAAVALALDELKHHVVSVAEEYYREQIS